MRRMISGCEIGMEINMLNKNFFKKAVISVMSVLLIAAETADNGLAGWTECYAQDITGMITDENGAKYWYENGIKQGTEGRGKEIYDPETDTWYWLDAVDGGKVATGKDVYQESDGGKWVRYDENGKMIKGWDTNEAGQYYFDLITGAMAKGATVIGGTAYCFDDITGVLLGKADKIFIIEDGNRYWYENGVKQGTKGRGKEIYDPETDAWYWLDSVDGGKAATSKDVYQESWAGKFADREDGTGKWVRYDENGHMIKGWSEQNGNRYYFDTVTGAMAKGDVKIDGIWYCFDKETGIFQDNEDRIDHDEIDKVEDDKEGSGEEEEQPDPDGPGWSDWVK